MFLLCGATGASVRILRAALDEFGDQSGLRPNLQKIIFCVSAVDDDLNEELIQCSGIYVGEVPFCYVLGCAIDFF